MPPIETGCAYHVLPYLLGFEDPAVLRVGNRFRTHWVGNCCGRRQ